ncbi:cob(I)yrinic acid a,c-diamide adenosyltransferase [Roseivirga pacifica]|uniref:cob(I)yrinic acid a,c-diamide adenosyltransferase n=1 Tax=Roseivirga pacifica TaxID=1267423 RepID=UPI00209433BD|nr:cob(I)yrinic acid a,c-diamide adenosyltransferase [Roseivirga pacifica]MCO6360189.1 cob(I)yrinic acid a,c-diamide adenosyltransferase [Roseivirga pacifica]MCO6367560.1 cob(I)yrinic acid a,c-diamide adenosyltransferase [Roseivirga pacifica]MCO6369908.1 cob(I)yrinic acid a,c-diamide adenosyltransferase [Roseivirga pacifica]MCO6375217.1 cob(I)yrinic acid a,c-diamide adenosyltransferase [Roseivirga pacifica]MCO6380475.1 cob(I)yrinic acid a,c-diamide adenosyltransferase [Roseivirga pacifica]
MKIYTKTGDKGSTSLLGGARVSKAHLRIEAYGTVDELNSYIGLLRDQPANEQRKDLLKTIQDRLFTLGAELATEPGKDKVVKPDLFDSDVQLLETEMDKMEADLPALTNFILPGGHQSVSYAHIARCVCRRAERISVALGETEPVAEIVTQYLNRLSDFLFVLGRKMAQDLEAEEVKWEPRKK